MPGHAHENASAGMGHVRFRRIYFSPMPRKKVQNEIPQSPEAKPPVTAPLSAEAFFRQSPEKRKSRRRRNDALFPEIEPPPPLPPKPEPIRIEAPKVMKAFDELNEEEIADDLRAQLWPHRNMLVNRMLEFAQQDENKQVAERTTSKLVERLYGKIPSTKVELGEEERGLAVNMRPGIYEREDDIPDGTERPEGYEEADDDEQALIKEDAAVEEFEEDEEDEDE